MFFSTKSRSIEFFNPFASPPLLEEILKFFRITIPLFNPLSFFLLFEEILKFLRYISY